MLSAVLSIVVSRYYAAAAHAVLCVPLSLEWRPTWYFIVAIYFELFRRFHAFVSDGTREFIG